QRRPGGALDSLHPTRTRAATAAEQAQTGVTSTATTQDFLSGLWTPAKELVVPTFDAAALISNGLRRGIPSNPRSRVSTYKRSGITNDPNRPDDPQYIVRLIAQVITVSLGTVKTVKALPPLP